MDDFQKLLFERAAVRGETVTLHEELCRALEHQHLPVAVRRLAGEVTVSALLAAGALQFDGSVLLQIAGDGPVKLIVAEVRKDLVFRVSVTMRDDAGEIDPNASLADLVNRTGRGRCALILDPTDRAADQQPYQGVVPLTGSSFAEVMTNYFIASEQVETKIVLASDEQNAGGLMIQKMPILGGKTLPENFDEDGWQRLQLFAGSVRSEELLTLASEDINRRLFWEESPVVTYETKPVFRCRCSNEAVENMIRSLGETEALEIVKERGKIEITCHFCGEVRSYDEAAVQALFAEKNKTLN